MVDEKRALYFNMIDTNKEFAELKKLYKEIKEMLQVLQDRGEPSEKNKLVFVLFNENALRVDNFEQFMLSPPLRISSMLVEAKAIILIRIIYISEAFSKTIGVLFQTIS